MKSETNTEERQCNKVIDVAVPEDRRVSEKEDEDRKVSRPGLGNQKNVGSAHEGGATSDPSIGDSSTTNE